MANILSATLTEKPPVTATITETKQFSCEFTEILVDDLTFIKFDGNTVTYFGVPMLMGGRKITA